MNTYQVTYFPPVGAPVILTAQAEDYEYMADVVVFTVIEDGVREAVLSVPTGLDPVVQRLSGAATTP